MVDIIEYFPDIARVLTPLRVLELVVVSYVGEIGRDVFTYLLVAVPSCRDISSFEANQVRVVPVQELVDLAQYAVECLAIEGQKLGLVRAALDC